MGDGRTGCLHSPKRHRQALDWNRPEDETKCAYRLLDEAAAEHCMQPTASLCLRQLMPTLGGLKRRRFRAVLLDRALDVRAKRWHTLILK